MKPSEHVAAFKDWHSQWNRASIGVQVSFRHLMCAKLVLVVDYYQGTELMQTGNSILILYQTT